jgi:hypothetical protein
LPGDGIHLQWIVVSFILEDKLQKTRFYNISQIDSNIIEKNLSTDAAAWRRSVLMVDAKNRRIAPYASSMLQTDHKT